MAWDPHRGSGECSRAGGPVSHVPIRAGAAAAGRIGRSLAAAGQKWSGVGNTGGHLGGLGARLGAHWLRTLLDQPQMGLNPVALLDNHPASWNRTVESVPVIGPLGLAPDFERHVEAAIVALADIGKEDAGTVLQELNFPRLIVIPDLAGVASLWVTARDLGGALGFEVKKNLASSPQSLAEKGHGPSDRALLPYSWLACQ